MQLLLKVSYFFFTKSAFVFIVIFILERESMVFEITLNFHGYKRFSIIFLIISLCGFLSNGKNCFFILLLPHNPLILLHIFHFLYLDEKYFICDESYVIMFLINRQEIISACLNLNLGK